MCTRSHARTHPHTHTLTRTHNKPLTLALALTLTLALTLALALTFDLTLTRGPSVTFNTLALRCEQYPIILDPAFKLQHRMQVKTLGEAERTNERMNEQMDGWMDGRIIEWCTYSHRIVCAVPLTPDPRTPTVTLILTLALTLIPTLTLILTLPYNVPGI